MAIVIQDANFTTSGIPLALSGVYIDVMVIFPHGTADAEARLVPYPYEGGIKGEVALAQIDGIRNHTFPPLALVQNDFWHDINAGNAHDYVIAQMEAETPAWAGKVVKVTPIT